jgi:TetR/AcrR family transcriptional regulator
MLCSCSASFGECLASTVACDKLFGMTTSSHPRRIGAADSKTRAQLLDAAEQLLLDEGYAAVTSRRVGARAGLKPQLVHYYFRTMDDLFLEVFRRRADENLAYFERAVSEEVSLRTLWRLNADPRGAAFMTEFVALANHRKTIRAEIARYAERSRAAQLAALTAALEADGITAEQLPPTAALLLMTGLTQVLSLERVLGVTAGHGATVAFVQSVIDRLEP